MYFELTAENWKSNCAYLDSNLTTAYCARYQETIIDAEADQEKTRAPYRFRGMTIREVPIGKTYPCLPDLCEELRRGDCPEEVLCCPDCKSVSWPVPSTEEIAKDVERIKERMRSIPNMPELEEPK